MAVNEKLRRVLVPAAVVTGVVAAGAGLYPALASDGSPDLPEVTAEELIVRIAESDTQELSGTVRVRTAFEIPGLEEMARSFGGSEAGRLAALASGSSTVRVAVDGPERQRLELGSGSEEFTVIHNRDDLWVYDAAGNTVYHSAVPEHPEGKTGAEAEEWDPSAGLTPQEMAERVLAETEGTAELTVQGTGRVAGQDVYQLLVEPAGDRGDAGLLSVESVRISVDAETGLPLAVTVNSPERQLLDVAFSQISYDKPAGGTFEFTPPKGAEVIEINPDAPFESLLGSGFGPELFEH
ncbi:hypothetical protein [Streptomyces sp. YIM 98790]|uniref:LolA family protein n=1 Tax=Streptomyces sp. YIM 98790 TaxID=2689077 RepID=UPI00140B4B1B|nr:hypothetical protein [Streptomyces sp. YIM 98790]